LFYTPANFKSMAFQFPEFGLMAMGMALAMLTGGSDLSVVNTGNLTAIVVGTVIARMASPEALGSNVALILLLALFLALMLGFLFGAFNGFLISKIGIPPILTTLGTSQLYNGLGIVITKGTTLTGFPALLNKIGNGAAFGFLPYPLIVFVIAFLIITFIVQKSSFGFRLYMLGTNSIAASFSGIPKAKMLIRAYALSGMLSALAGIVILARNNSANADYGSNYIMQTILVAVMAGFNPNGGKGRITGIVLAVITLQMLSSALNMTNITSFFKQLVYGFMLLALVIANSETVSSWINKSKRNRARM
jgi:simple sugar transport system permease protein